MDEVTKIRVDTNIKDCVSDGTAHLQSKRDHRAQDKAYGNGREIETTLIQELSLWEEGTGAES